MRLKISVLASGVILVDGQAADLEQLDGALQTAKQNRGHVWYYREAAGAEPPPTGLAVIQRVVQLKLPFSMSSKADFSDWVDGKGVSRPRVESTAAPGVGPRMPDVSIRSDIQEVFARLRLAAAGGIAILKPDRTHLAMPRLAATPSLESMAKNMDRMVPGAVTRNIAAIAYTHFDDAAGGVPGLAEVSKAIPFLGILVGLSYIGHAVWVFEGHGSALAAGCRDADVLIVDSAMRAFLLPQWDSDAVATMRNPNLLIYDRTSSQLQMLRRHPGTDDELLHFPN